MENEISTENYKTVDIGSIALDRNRLGTLVFESAGNYLKQLQDLFNELEELEYQNILTPNEASEIENRRTTLIEYLNRVRVFDINQPNPGEQHDQLERETENFHNDTARQLRPFLTALRQDVALRSQDQKSLQKEAKQAQQAKKAYEDLSKELTAKIKNLEAQQAKVETGFGKLASKILARHFDEEAKKFESEARNWLKNRNLFFWILVGVVGFNAVLFLALSTKFWVFKNTKIDDVFNLQYLGIKIALVAILSYGIAFASKNYRVNSNLAFINRHRRSVAQTMEDYLATNPRPEIQDQIIKEGVRSMFQHIHIGYSSHKEAGDGGPANEIITNVFKNLPPDRGSA